MLSSTILCLYPIKKTASLTWVADYPTVRWLLSNPRQLINLKARVNVLGNQFNFRYPQHYNTSWAELSALRCFHQCQDIIIKPVKEGGDVVVWSTDLCKTDVLYQPQEISYCLLPFNPMSHCLLVTILFTPLFYSYHLRPQSVPPASPPFTSSPKIHKSNNPDCHTVPRLQLSHWSHLQIPWFCLYTPSGSFPSNIHNLNQALHTINFFCFALGPRLPFILNIKIITHHHHSQ